MIGYRHVDARFPFLREDATQPAGRWHDEGEGPVAMFADTPDGAWAELVRHEEIVEEADLATITRALWAVDLGRAPAARPRLPRATLTGGVASYPACRREAQRLRESGAGGLVAPSAALRDGEAAGWRSDGGLRRGPRRNGKVIVLFGPQPDLVGWCATEAGRPPADLLSRVRPPR